MAQNTGLRGAKVSQGRPKYFHGRQLLPNFPCLWLFPTLKPCSLPVVVAQPDERHANNSFCVEVVRQYRAYTAYGSNEEKYSCRAITTLNFQLYIYCVKIISASVE